MTPAHRWSRRAPCTLALIFLSILSTLAALSTSARAGGAAPPPAPVPSSGTSPQSGVGPGPGSGPWPWEDRFLIAPPAEVLAAARALPPPPDATVEVLLEERVVRFEADGRAVIRFRQVYRALTEPDDEWRALGTTWDTWREERPTLRARVITPDGQAHPLDPATIENRGTQGKDPEIYDDTQVVRAPLPGVGAGSIVELEIVTADRMPWFDAGIAGRYYLWTSTSLRKTRLVLDAPSSLPLKFVARGRSVPRPVAAQAEGRRTYTFEGGPYATTPPLPPGTPPEDQLPPHIGYTTGQSWARVATRYAAIVEGQLRGVDVGARVHEATRGDAGRADVIARLVAALRRDVRYTGVEFGDASIVPRPPAAVLERRYGDCKDMALLLVAMLRAAGIEAHVALLRAGFGADIDEELPGLGFFNHAIVYVPGSGSGGAPGPAGPSGPFWIDPSARFSPPGELPPADQGRRALVARTGTTALVKTPVASSAQNLVREQREILLDEDGSARVRETSEVHGALAESYRSAYNDTARAAHEKKLAEYARKVYGAPSLKRVSWSEPTDLSGPFRLELEAEEATPARIDNESATIYLGILSLLAELPEELQGDDPEEAPSGPPRTVDFVYQTGYRHELRWRVVPPHGYAPEPPPPPRRIKLGPAMIEITLATTPDGAATATVTFDSGRTRLSPAELTTFQEALRELRQEPATALRFVHTGQAHLAAGRVREALIEFRRLQAAHPDAVLHRTQIARAYLAAGLGEAARREAQSAVAVAPRSLEAHMTLGWVLEHDLIGRRLLPGADRAGAERAYRQVIAIDPKAYGARASLALLFEHDTRGGHTWPRERLADAIAEYDVLHEAGHSEYHLNHALALFRLERWPAAAALARKLGTVEGSALVVAVTLLTQGSAAALRELQTLVPENGKRAEALRLAGAELIQVRRYPEAGMLLTEAAARGHVNAAALRAQGGVLARVRRFEDVRLDRRDPKAVALATLGHLVIAGVDGDPRSLTALRSLLAPPLYQILAREPEWRRNFSLGVRKSDSQTAALPSRVLADTLFAAEASIEGQPRWGYRVHTPSMSQEQQGRIIVVPRDDGYRVLALPGSGEPLLGGEALRLVEAGDLDGARQMLDWAVEEAPEGTTEEPLSGSYLRRLWPRGTRGDAPMIRCAAAVAQASDDRPEAALVATLTHCRDGANTEASKLSSELALGEVLRRQKRWGDAQVLAQGLLARYPQSRVAFFTTVLTMQAAGHLAEARALLEQRLGREPEDREAREQLALLVAEGGDLRRCEELLRALVAGPRPSASVLNELAWLKLLRGQANEETLTLARRSVELSQRRVSAILHTLATALAEQGQPEEALATLRESLDREPRDAPDRSDWYVIGRAAELYGAKEVAEDAYRHISRPETPSPLDVWHLVERRRQRPAPP